VSIKNLINLFKTAGIIVNRPARLDSKPLSFHSIMELAGKIIG
jgi:hypothetical protein